ncbi:hypothetical protein HW115_03105 [Verrucomicrobiaceae bacterium N1E253]|uniref:Uncharacterized protein n=1 Tax=Oceaniferula marina TaxID=2748318 RepID=A0A851GAD7_9BACT|nr:hypothetical protein [Oceaniferula marina]NWK54583.1 hypothetical protein [Oceaniferula marina]
MLHCKRRWERWWKSTGQQLAKQKKSGAKVDRAAFQMAWEFLGRDQESSTQILPVWMPETWRLYLSYSNGDYMGREKELWIVDRKKSGVRMFKLRGDYRDGAWAVHLSEYQGLTLERGDRVYKALNYLHHYAPKSAENQAGDELGGLYYPCAVLRLRDGQGRILRNAKGYDFSKSRPEYGDGDPGRSYYFLKSIFSNQSRWLEVTNPSCEHLAPYREFLSLSQPYFTPEASEIVELFGSSGRLPEKRVLLKWAEKQKAATNPEMSWLVCSGDFGTAAKSNVIGSSRVQILETLKAVQKIDRRLVLHPDPKLEDAKGGADEHQQEVLALERYIHSMKDVEKREKESAILSFPEPLRHLIAIDERSDDPDLKHLKAAIQAIRNNPAPELFKQMAVRLDDGNMRIRSLMESILVEHQGLSGLKPWGAKEEAVAVDVCVGMLPYVGDGEREDLVEMLLLVCGGGVIEIEGTNGGRRIEVIIKENGRTLSYGAASSPLSIKNAQNELRRLYFKSKAEDAEGGASVPTPGDALKPERP